MQRQLAPKYILTRACAVGLILLTLGGPNAIAAGNKVVGFISTSAEDWYGDEIRKACDAKAKELDYSTEAVYHHGDPELMGNVYRQLIDEKVAAIVAYPTFAGDSAALTKLAKDAGIPVVVVGKASPSDKEAIAEIVYDQTQGAKLAATAFVNLMKEKGNYIQLDGRPGIHAQARSRAYQEVLSQAPDLKKLAAVNADWDLGPAQTETTALLTRYPDIQGILCANDLMAMGAAQAVAASGQKKIIVGFDGTPDGLKFIQMKLISATVQYPTREMGQRAMEDADQAIRTGKIAGERVQVIPCTIYPFMELPAISQPQKELTFNTVASGLKNDLTYLLDQYKNPAFYKLHDNDQDFGLMKELVHNSLANTDTIINAKINYSQKYVASLNYDRTGFSNYAEHARTNTHVPQETVALLQADAKGLAAKATFALFGGNSDVMVTAKTIRLVNGEKKEFSGYSVFYNHVTDPDVNKDSFYGLTSPTDPQPIPPDEWVIWAEKDGKASARKKYTLGEHAQPLTIELDAVQ